jgi:hypothetical protein
MKQVTSAMDNMIGSRESDSDTTVGRLHTECCMTTVITVGTTLRDVCGGDVRKALDSHGVWQGSWMLAATARFAA